MGGVASPPPSRRRRSTPTPPTLGEAPKQRPRFEEGTTMETRPRRRPLSCATWSASRKSARTTSKCRKTCRRPKNTYARSPIGTNLASATERWKSSALYDEGGKDMSSRTTPRGRQVRQKEAHRATRKGMCQSPRREPSSIRAAQHRADTGRAHGASPNRWGANQLFPRSISARAISLPRSRPGLPLPEVTFGS